MLKQLLKKLLKQLGYEIKKKDFQVQENTFYQLYAYTRKDGSFDYNAYKQIQTAGNKRKVEAVWVMEENIAYISQYIKESLGQPQFGICHGTRSGKEQAWFRHYLGCDVLGTEISDTAETFENTIQWDFHETKPEWLGKADFIYSNSFDHSYDPEKCLNAWMSCLKPGGICIIEHCSSNDHARALDPFGAHISHMPYLILNWAKGNFWVRQIIDTPEKREYLDYSCFIIVQNNPNPRSV